MAREIDDLNTESIEGLQGMQGVNFTGEEVFDRLDSEEFEDLPKVSAAQRMNYTARNTDYYTPIGLEHIDDFGSSRLDKRVSSLEQLRNLNEFRAQEQSSVNKVLSGLAKATGIMGTTFLDSTVGTLAGVMEGIYNLEQGDSFLKGFSQNSYSTLLQEFNDKLEESLPNYYTMQEVQNEQNGEWYKNIWSANFLGDKVLKPLGFTAGAVLGAGATSGATGLRNITQLNKYRNFFTNIAKNNGDDFIKAVISGGTIDGTGLSNSLKNAASAYKRATATESLIGSVLAAQSEARIEAINAAKEFRDNVSKLDSLQEQDVLAAIRTLQSEHPEYFDASGNPLPDYANDINNTIASIVGKYDNAKASIEEEAAKIGNAVFIPNLVLLTFTDMLQFGRFFAGGERAAKMANSFITKSEKGFEASKAARNAGRAMAVVKGPGSESFEEVAQSGISSASKYYYGSKLNEQYRAAIDPDANSKAVNALNAAMYGFKDSFLNPGEHGEEAFIGFITGALGIPAFRRVEVKGQKNAGGTPKTRIEFTGSELFSGWREAGDKYREAEEWAKVANERLQDPKFQELYSNLAKKIYYENIKENALEKGDSFEYKTADTKQLLSDIQLFSRLGRLQELYDKIDSVSNLSEEDIETIKTEMTSSTTGHSVYDGMDNNRIREAIQNNANKVKKAINNYQQTMSDLNTVYGNNIDSDVIEEMAWDINNISRLEERRQSLQEEISADVNEAIDRLRNAGIAEDEIEAVSSAYEDVLSYAQGTDSGHLRDFITNLFSGSEVGAKLSDLLTRSKQSKDRIAQADKEYSDKVEALNNLKHNALKSYRDEAKLKKIRKNLEKAQKELAKAEVSAVPYSEDELSKLKDNVNKAQKAFDKADTIYDDKGNALGTYTELKAKYNTDRETSIKVENDKIEKLEKLAKLAEDSGGTISNPLEARDAASRLTDFLKIVDTRNMFVSMYETLVKHPEVFTEEFREAQKEAIREATDRLTEAVVSSLRNLSTTEEMLPVILDLVKRNPDLLDELVRKMPSRGTNPAFDNAVDIIKAAKIFTDIFRSMPHETAQEHASHIIDEALTNASSVEDVKATLNDIASIRGLSREVAQVVREALNKFNEQWVSVTSTTTPDPAETTVPRSPIKKAVETVKKKAESFADRLRRRESVDMTTEDDEIVAAEVEAAKTPVSVYTPTETHDDISLVSIDDAVRTGTLDEDLLRKELLDLPDAKLRKLAVNGLDAATDELNEVLTSMALSIIDERTAATTPTSEELVEESVPTESGVISEQEEIVLGNKLNTHIEDELNLEVNYDNVIDELKELYVTDPEKFKAASEGKLDYSDEINAHIKKICSAIILGNQSVATENSLGEGISSDEVPLSTFTKGTQLKLLGIGQTKHSFSTGKTLMERKGLTKHTEDIIKTLDSFGVYDFIDSGEFADRFYREQYESNKNGGPGMQIHVVSNVRIGDANLTNELMLVIDAKSTDPESSLIKCHDGKSYRVVGMLEIPSNSNVTQSRALINKLKEDIKKERAYAGLNNSSAPYISSYNCAIDTFYPGRIMHTREGEAETEHDITKDYFRNGERPHLGIVYSDGSFRTPSIARGGRVLTPRNTETKPGSVFIMVKAADGRYWPSGVKVKRFMRGENEFSAEKYSDTPIFRAIREAIKTIVDPKSTNLQRLHARDDLQNLLYFPEGHKPLFFEKDGKVSFSIANKFNGMDLTDGAEDIGTAVNNVIDAMQSPDSGMEIRMQVATRLLSNPEYVNRLIESGILTTNELEAQTRIGGFVVTYPVLGTANYTVESGEPLIERNEPIKSYTAYAVGKANYELSADRTSIRNADTHEEVTDPLIRAAVKLQAEIVGGTVNEMYDNSDLYIGSYINKQGEIETYGIIRNVIYTGDKLAERIDYFKKLDDQAKKKAAAKEIAGKIDNGINVAVESSTNETEDSTPIPTVGEQGKVIETPTENSGAVRAEDLHDDTSGATISTSGSTKAIRVMSKSPLFKNLVGKDKRFGTVNEFMKFVNDPNNRLKPLETIDVTNITEIDEYLKMIEECR